MAKGLSIVPSVLKRLRALPERERADGLLALCDLGIRKLDDGIYECRAGLALRFVFIDRADDLLVTFLGNHDEIKALMKRGKYR